MIRLFFFGAPQIEQSTAATWLHLTPKAMSLFVYLAVTQRAHSRDVLADLLWSETNNQQARNNLRYLLPELRRSLGDYLLITPKSIAFNGQAPYWLDVERLRATLSSRTEAIATPALQAALQLYQGEFLAGFTVRNTPIFETWLVQQREELHTLVVQSGYALANRYWQAAEYQPALTATQQLLHWEPWHEGGHRLQMQLLAASGQRAAALAQYALCQQILAAELGVAPEAATTALYEQIRSNEPDKVTSDKVTGDKVAGNTVTGDKVTSDKVTTNHPVILSFPHRVTLSVPNNLPQQTTSFIGRNKEVAEICTRILTTDYRLLTLVGEGGIGKTRLGLAVAQAIVDVCSQKEPAGSNDLKFPDGIWFLSLSDLIVDSNLTERLATMVAKTIGLSFSGKQPLFTQLLAQLRRKALFLLFDNAEHHLPAITDFLLQLLQQSARTTILVTSRHLLNLQAETVWRVAGLSVPPPVAAATLSMHELATYSSIALFVERANHTQRRFLLTPANGPTIAAICRLVDGLPLAIELAAALTKQYTCADLYSALQRDYTILVAAESDRTAHHHSIQAMIAYSWRFLTAEEARLLAACAIFAGGFTRAAAQIVTGAAPALLLNLLDQSLLQLRAGRFFMHELIRHYAAAQLAQLPEYQAQVAAVHAAYYIAQLHEQEVALVIDVAAQQIIQDEIENIRVAWCWSLAHGDLALLTKGLEGLHYFYRLTGTYQEAIQLLEAALATVRHCLVISPTAPQPLSLMVRLLCHLAEFYRRMDSGKTGEPLAQEALAVAQQLPDPALQGFAYHTLARLAYTHNDRWRTRDLAEAGYRQALQANTPHLIAECLNDLGLATSVCMGPLSALPYYHQALTVLQGAPNRLLEAFVLVNLAYHSLVSGQYQAAYTYLQQGLAWQHQLRDRGGRVPPLVHLLNLWLALGEYHAIQPIFDEALAVVQITGNHYWESRLYSSYGRWQQLCGDPQAARSTCSYAQQLAERSGAQLQKQWVLICLGHAHAALGENDAAMQSYQQAIALHEPARWLYYTAEAQAGLAALFLSQNKVAEALPPTEAALTLLAEQGLAAATEPFTVYWTAVRVLRAAGDPRAIPILRTATHALLATAAQLIDPSHRRSFLETVAVNRDLLAAAQDAGVTA